MGREGVGGRERGREGGREGGGEGGGHYYSSYPGTFTISIYAYTHTLTN